MVAAPAGIAPGDVDEVRLAVCVRADRPLVSPGGSRFQVVELLVAPRDDRAILIRDAVDADVRSGWLRP